MSYLGFHVLPVDCYERERRKEKLYVLTDMQRVDMVMIQFAVDPKCLVRIDVHVHPLSDEIQTVQVVKYL